MVVKEATMSPEESMLKNEQFGNPISEKLSNYLRTYTGKDDRANVSRMTGVGSSTVRDVAFRNNNLTESNSRAIIELMRIAIINCNNLIEDAGKAITDLKSILNE
ncbi:hypothetical protein SAMN06296241_1393 [Salinimicrobium sediminis]|uniref:Uncharacterized protein n=1 Tax=Salinimicrobium sediminis TaxID=1343891 RepID=A0A285X3G5_9FLAO|nr:hypothetical protein [Salinimicrobium sediminis]SOC79855.1 hypothetical protein SAMN06296241_1393 [Salinimicrobium sediminis]